MARGLAGSLRLLLWTISGIEVLFSSAEESGDASLLRLIDLQMVVLTMKLPETDFVFVIDRAARKNTFDFELVRTPSSFSTTEMLAD